MPALGFINERALFLIRRPPAKLNTDRGTLGMFALVVLCVATKIVQMRSFIGFSIVAKVVQVRIHFPLMIEYCY